MKKMAKKALFSPVTTIAIVLGIIGMVTGILTATGHNVLFGGLGLILGYVNYRAELSDDMK